MSKCKKLKEEQMVDTILKLKSIVPASTLELEISKLSRSGINRLLSKILEKIEL